MIKQYGINISILSCLLTALSLYGDNIFSRFSFAADGIPSFDLALLSGQAINELLSSIPVAVGLIESQSKDIAPSDGATINVSAPGWSETIQLIRIAKADASGSRLATRLPEDGFSGKVGSLIVGDDGNDVITGGFGWDAADGGSGNDLVKTGNGRDMLCVGLSADELWGGFGWTIFRSEIDGSSDRLVIRSDHWLKNPRLGNTAGNNADDSKVDVIERLDSNDLIVVQGVNSGQVSVRSGAVANGVSGIGIYANNVLEGLYTGSNLTASQLQAMVIGDDSQAAIDNTIFGYGSAWLSA